MSYVQVGSLKNKETHGKTGKVGNYVNGVCSYKYPNKPGL